MHRAGYWLQEKRSSGQRLRDRGNPHHDRDNPPALFCSSTGAEKERRSSRALCVVPLAVEVTFLAGNSAKVMQGGWLSLAIGAVVFLQMTTWKKGRYLLRKDTCSSETSSRRRLHLDVDPDSPHACRALRCFWRAAQRGASIASAHLKHNRVLHERNIGLTILTDRIPYVARNARIEIKDLSRFFPNHRSLRLYGNTDDRRDHRTPRDEGLCDRGAKNELLSGTRDNHLHGEAGYGVMA